MATTPALYDTLWAVFSTNRQVWGDVRRLRTFLWMMVGLIMEGAVHLPDWAPYVVSRARQAASTVRRFARWLHNSRIDPHRIWRAYVQEVLASWNGEVTVVLDTTLLWNVVCWIRVSIVYRGRALPIAWRLIRHRSARVGFRDYRPALEQAVQALPEHLEVLFLADRGFADRALIAWLQAQGWHWRLRLKRGVKVYRPRHGWRPVSAFLPGYGHALCLHGVFVDPTEKMGPFHLAVGWAFGSQDPWYLLSDEPTTPETFAEYRNRMLIEAEILDNKSNGFHIHRSVLRDPQALDRLGLVLAAVTLFLVAQGVAVVERQERRTVDPHWYRGCSYLKIGWRYLKRALFHPTLPLLQRLTLPPDPDPLPAMASRAQANQTRLIRFYHHRIVYAQSFVSQ